MLSFFFKHPMNTATNAATFWNNGWNSYMLLRSGHRSCRVSAPNMPSEARFEMQGNLKVFNRTFWNIVMQKTMSNLKNFLLLKLHDQLSLSSKGSIFRTFGVSKCRSLWCQSLGLQRFLRSFATWKKSLTSPFWWGFHGQRLRWTARMENWLEMFLRRRCEDFAPFFGLQMVVEKQQMSTCKYFWFSILEPFVPFVSFSGWLSQMYWKIIQPKAVVSGTSTSLIQPNFCSQTVRLLVQIHHFLGLI